jgi:hypothetical protein
MSLTSSVSINVSATQKGALDIATLGASVARQAALSFATGVGAGKADLLFSDTRTLAASATEDFDLAGTVTDAFGAILSFAKIKAIVIVAATTNVNDVVIGGATSNGFVAPFGAATDKIKIRPGGIFVLACDGGYAVTAATADLLKIANSSSGTPVTFDLIIIGASA